MTSCCSVQETCIRREIDKAPPGPASRVALLTLETLKAVFIVLERVYRRRVMPARLRVELLTRLERRRLDCE